jgi:hypothetical protein
VAHPAAGTAAFHFDFPFIRHLAEARVLWDQPRAELGMTFLIGSLGNRR